MSIKSIKDICGIDYYIDIPEYKIINTPPQYIINEVDKIKFDRREFLNQFKFYQKSIDHIINNKMLIKKSKFLDSKNITLDHISKRFSNKYNINEKYTKNKMIELDNKFNFIIPSTILSLYFYIYKNNDNVTNNDNYTNKRNLLLNSPYFKNTNIEMELLINYRFGDVFTKINKDYIYKLFILTYYNEIRHKVKNPQPFLGDGIINLDVIESTSKSTIEEEIIIGDNIENLYSPYSFIGNSLLVEPEVEIELIKDKVINNIKNFKPEKEWHNENNYHIELMGWLKNNFNVNYEVQKGSSRPDLVIDNIAIEIKGPTTNEELKTIASKLLRYNNYWEDIILVLFERNYTDNYYNEFESGIKKRFPEVIIIKK